MSDSKSHMLSIRLHGLPLCGLKTCAVFLPSASFSGLSVSGDMWVSTYVLCVCGVYVLYVYGVWICVYMCGVCGVGVYVYICMVCVCLYSTSYIYGSLAHQGHLEILCKSFRKWPDSPPAKFWKSYPERSHHLNVLVWWLFAWKRAKLGTLSHLPHSKTNNPLL